MNLLIRLIGAIGILLLLVYWRSGKVVIARLGQAFIIAAFGLIAYELLRSGSLWIGLAFAASAMWQVWAISSNKLKEKRSREADD